VSTNSRREESTVVTERDSEEEDLSESIAEQGDLSGELDATVADVATEEGDIRNVFTRRNDATPQKTKN